MASTLPHFSDCCSPCDEQPVDLTTVDNEFIGWFLREVLDDLRSIASASTNKVCKLVGLITPGDGQGGDYWWNNDSTEADDGLNIIEPDDAPAAGRWIRQI